MLQFSQTKSVPNKRPKSEPKKRLNQSWIHASGGCAEEITRKDSNMRQLDVLLDESQTNNITVCGALIMDTFQM